jgi:hypothetical protein
MNVLGPEIDAADLSAASAGLRFSPKVESYSIDLPPIPSSVGSVMAFSHAKAGSTMLNAILEMLCPHVGLTFASISGRLFERGVAMASAKVQTEFHAKGYCYGGFRFFPLFALPLLDTAKAIFLVRDPRDALVSLYFSKRDSHVLPPAQTALGAQWTEERARAAATSIDDWVIQYYGRVVGPLAGYMAQGFTCRPNVTIYRYEDVIFRKRDWIADICDWYGWTVPASVIEAVAREMDIFPEREDPRKHIRQVHPGNHRQLLSDKTQDLLEVAFGPWLRAFGYA